MWEESLAYAFIGLGGLLLLPLSLAVLCCLGNLICYAGLWCFSWRCPRCLQRNHCSEERHVRLTQKQAESWNIMTDTCPCSEDRIHTAHCSKPCEHHWRIRISGILRLPLDEEEFLYMVCPCARCKCGKCAGVSFDCSCQCYYCCYQYQNLLPCHPWMVLSMFLGLLLLTLGLLTLWWGDVAYSFIIANIHNGAVIGMLIAVTVFLTLLVFIIMQCWRQWTKKARSATLP